jgi:hypothetical protein
MYLSYFLRAGAAFFLSRRLFAFFAPVAYFSVP